MNNTPFLNELVLSLHGNLLSVSNRWRDTVH
uniref:Uncharacterized protein n=1 Tax=Anguilla anguilla TaxID=7936 RepID=A0A0E9V982_ANGAN